MLQPGDTLSIQVELVDTQDNTQLWGEQYSRQPDEILALQEEIARAISEKLRLQLSGEEREQLAKRGTENPEAYQDYLQGRYHSNQRSPNGLARAVEYFNQAIDKDPNYARAYSGLADSYFLQVVYAGRTVEDLYQQELAAAQKALELDDTLAEAHTSMGRITGMHGWDWSLGERHLKRAIELNPNYTDAYISYGGLLTRQGRLNEGVEQKKKAVALDPLITTTHSQLGRALWLSRLYDEAIHQLQVSLEMNPNGGAPRSNLRDAYWFKGMYAEAIAQAEKAASLGGGPNIASFSPPGGFRQSG